jgi:O-antigen ligase
MTVARARTAAAITAVVVLVALSLTYVRSAWVALIAAGIAHIVASRGRSARPVLTAAAIVVATTLALAPVSPAARSVLDRFNTLGDLSVDRSANDRQATFSETLPKAVSAPLGHGLGSAGEPSKLNETQGLRTPDNGYLALAYQVGPIGFLLVVAALGFIVRAAWNGAQARAPGQDLRVLLFTMLIFMLVLLTAGDEFYGSLGLILWFISGQVLAFEHRQRVAAARLREVEPARLASAPA